VCVREREREREKHILRILTDSQLEISKVIAPELFKQSVQKARLLKIIPEKGLGFYLRS